MRVHKSRVLLQFPQLREGLFAEVAFVRANVEVDGADVGAVRVAIVERLRAFVTIHRPTSLGVHVWLQFEACDDGND